MNVKLAELVQRLYAQADDLIDRAVGLMVEDPANPVLAEALRKYRNDTRAALYPEIYAEVLRQVAGELEELLYGGDL